MEISSMPSKGLPVSDESDLTSTADDQKKTSAADGRQRNHSGKPNLNPDTGMDSQHQEKMTDRHCDAWNRQNLNRVGESGGSTMPDEESSRKNMLRTQMSVHSDDDDDDVVSSEESNNNVNPVSSELPGRKLSTSQQLETIPEIGSDDIEQYDNESKCSSEAAPSDDSGGNKAYDRVGQMNTPKRKLQKQSEGEDKTLKKGNHKKGVKFDDKTTELVIIPSDDSDHDSCDSKTKDIQDSGSKTRIKSTASKVVSSKVCKPEQQNTLKKNKKGVKRTSSEDGEDEDEEVVWVRQDSMAKLEDLDLKKKDLDLDLKETQLGKGNDLKLEHVTLKETQLGKEPKKVEEVVKTLPDESKTDLQGQLADGAAVKVVVANGKAQPMRKKDESAIREQLVEINVDLLCEGYMQPCSSLDNNCNSEEQRLLGDHPLPEALEDVST